MAVLKYREIDGKKAICYIEMDGDPTKNLDAFEKTIRMMKESGINYGAVNHPVDSDPICGYHGIIDDVCPLCGRHDGEAISIKELRKKGIKTKYNPDENGNVGDDVSISHLRRITGYLVGDTKRFNHAKFEEEKHRVKHGVIDLDEMLEKATEENENK